MRLRAAFWLGLVTCAACAPARRDEVVVLAAASLRDVCAELAAAFEREHGTPVVLDVAGSNLLARQILAGMPADVFLPAGAAPMDRVEEAGLVVPGTRVDLCSNTLVVVQPLPRPADVPAVLRAEDLADPGLGRVALAHPEAVPAGIYARAWLEHRGLWSRIEARVVPAVDVRAALALVRSGAAGAGLVYATDATSTSGVAVVLEVPAVETPTIVYPAALLRHARHPGPARTFHGFLGSQVAWDVFERHGFKRPAEVAVE